jgi:hypothetical protein
MAALALSLADVMSLSVATLDNASAASARVHIGLISGNGTWWFMNAGGGLDAGGADIIAVGGC